MAHSIRGDRQPLMPGMHSVYVTAVMSLVLPLCLGAAAACEKAAPAASLSSVAAGSSQPSSAASQGAASDSCGSPGQPRCPLQEWMRATLQAYLVRDDPSNLPRIAAALDKLANASPAEYSSWGALARRGAEAARRHDFPALKEACAGCHDAYRTQFRGSMRARRLF
jgi:hypothetical protein